MIVNDKGSKVLKLSPALEAQVPNFREAVTLLHQLELLTDSNRYMHCIQAMSLLIEAADHFENSRIADGRSAHLYAHLQIEAAERWQADQSKDRLEEEPNILANMKEQLDYVSDIILYSDYPYSRQLIEIFCDNVIAEVPKVLKELEKY